MAWRWSSRNVLSANLARHRSKLSIGVRGPIVGADPCRQRSGQGFTLNSILKISFALGVFLLPALPAEAARKYCEAQVSERLARISQTPLVICQFEPEISSRGCFAEPGDGLDCH